MVVTWVEIIVSQRIMWIIAVLPIIVALFCLAILFLLFRWWKTGAVLCVVALAMNYYTQSIPLNPFAWRSIDEQVKPEGCIRILEYNICHKDDYLARNLERYQELADFLLSKQADILILPEHFSPSEPQLDSILHANYPHSFETALRTGYEEESVFSKYPITACKNYRMDPYKLLERHPDADSTFVMTAFGSTMIYQVDLDIEGRDVTMVYVHMRSNNFDDAKGQGNRKRDKLRSVLEAMQSNYAYRASEAEAICDSLRQNENPLLICGDFNDVSGSHVITTLQQHFGLKDAWWERGFGPGFTFNDQHLLLRLDHLLYSRHFELLGVKVLSEAAFSDHEPLLFDLKLAE